MKLIALDQNVVSNLANPPNAVWSEILLLLEAGVKSRTILCPTSPVTLIETTHLPRVERQKIERVCREISGGYFVRFFWEIIAREALARVRPGVETFPLWVPDWLNETSEAQNEANSLAMWAEGDKLEAAVNSCELPGRQKNYSVQDAIYANGTYWFQLVVERLNKLTNGQMIGDEQFVIQQVCGALVELGVTDGEIAGMLQDIERGDWFEIPILTCWLSLEGLLLYDQIQRGGRFKCNDEWDKFRAGEAYQFAHCFITDGGMAGALKRLGLQDPDNFEVFSVTETNRIIEYLKAER
jgi:hypothetical protein